MRGKKEERPIPSSFTGRAHDILEHINYAKIRGGLLTLEASWLPFPAKVLPDLAHLVREREVELRLFRNDEAVTMTRVEGNRMAEEITKALEPFETRDEFLLCEARPLLEDCKGGVDTVLSFSIIVMPK